MRELHSPLHFSGLDWGQGLQSPEIFRPFRHIHGMGSETEAFHLGSIGHNHVLSIIVISSEMAKFYPKGNMQDPLYNITASMGG